MIFYDGCYKNHSVSLTKLLPYGILWFWRPIPKSAIYTLKSELNCVNTNGN